MPLCLSDWPERWDPHTQSKETSSREAGKTSSSSPCPGPGGRRLGLEPSWEDVDPTAHHPPFGRRPPPFSCRHDPSPPALRTPILPVTPAEVQMGRLQVGGVCMWVMLFGWKQRPFWRDKGRSGAGCGVRYSQPRAEPADGRAPCGNPSKDDRGASWGGQTIGTNSSGQRHHILNRFSLSAGYVVRLQPGSLPAVCWEVRAGPRAGHRPLPRSYGLLASLLLGVQRLPPETG